jgi:hypothetical protein
MPQERDFPLDVFIVVLLGKEDNQLFVYGQTHDFKQEYVTINSIETQYQLYGAAKPFFPALFVWFRL